MDIRFLTTFLEVAETRHFGRAAENLYLTQSAVSARIKLLEEYFNTALFIRNRNSIQITPAGEKLIPFARELSDILSETRRTLAEEECQHISCASTPNAFLLCFSSLLPSLMNEFESVSFRHEIVTIEQITRQLHEHSIDFALTNSLVKSDDINSQLLFEVPLSLYQTSDFLGERHDIHIDWSNITNDKLNKMYPEMRKAKLRTTSIDVALTMAKTKESRLILPVSSHRFLNDQLKQTLINLESEALSEEVVVPIYLNQLKSHKNTGVDKVILFMLNKVKK